MKDHLISLIGPGGRKKTILLFVAAVILIIISQVIGTTDNIPGLISLLVGVIILFFAVLHPWNSSRKYTQMAVGAVVLIMITFLIIFLLSLLHKTEYIGEGAVMVFVFLICVPAVITGILGALYWWFRNQQVNQH